MHRVVSLNDTWGSEIIKVDLLRQELKNDFLLLDGIKDIEFCFLTVPERGLDENFTVQLGKWSFDFKLVSQSVNVFDRNLYGYEYLGYLGVRIWVHLIDPEVSILFELKLFKLSQDKSFLTLVEWWGIRDDHVVWLLNLLQSLYKKLFKVIWNILYWMGM